MTEIIPSFIFNAHSAAFIFHLLSLRSVTTSFLFFFPYPNEFLDALCPNIIGKLLRFGYMHIVAQLSIVEPYPIAAIDTLDLSSA